MIDFTTGLIVSIGIATVLLIFIGWFLWRRMFGTRPKSFSAQLKQLDDAGVHQVESDLVAEPDRSLKPPAVSAAETIDNKSDEAVVDGKERSLSTQKTVENAGDVSISIDDDDPQETSS